MVRKEPKNVHDKWNMWHRYSITVNQVMVATVKLSNWLHHLANSNAWFLVSRKPHLNFRRQIFFAKNELNIRRTRTHIYKTIDKELLNLSFSCTIYTVYCCYMHRCNSITLFLQCVGYILEMFRMCGIW